MARESALSMTEVAAAAVVDAVPDTDAAHAQPAPASLKPARLDDPETDCAETAPRAARPANAMRRMLDDVGKR